MVFSIPDKQYSHSFEQMCLLAFILVSQVSDVAHGPLVFCIYYHLCFRNSRKNKLSYIYSLEVFVKLLYWPIFAWLGRQFSGTFE